MTILFSNHNSINSFATAIEQFGNHVCLRDLELISPYATFDSYQVIPLQNIYKNPSKQQSRKNGAKVSDVSKLAMQIQSIGLEVPILVLKTKAGSFEVVSGHHRHQAFEKLNSKHKGSYSAIPAIVLKPFRDKASERRTKAIENSKHRVAQNHTDQDAILMLDECMSEGFFPDPHNEKKTKSKARKELALTFNHFHTNKRESIIKAWWQTTGFHKVQEPQPSDVQGIVARIAKLHGMTQSASGVMCSLTNRVLFGSDVAGTAHHTFKKSLREFFFKSPKKMNNLTGSIMVVFKAKIGKTTEPKDIAKQRKEFEKWAKDWNDTFGSKVGVLITDLVYPPQILQAQSFKSKAKTIPACPSTGITKTWDSKTNTYI